MPETLTEGRHATDRVVRRASGRRTRPARAPEPGLRRVDWVRILLADDDVRAEATGVGFRIPVTVPIPLALAGELIASGTPFVVRRQDQD
jgi:hypothetical protein